MTAPVCFISPLTITASMITSSTAVTKLPGEQEWVNTGNYAAGTIVTRTFSGVVRRFENLIPGPNANPPEDDSERWYDHGSTDKMSMFDGEVGTSSMAPDALTVVFRPGALNSMYLVVEGQSLVVTIRDAPNGNVVHTFSQSLEKSEPPDYWEHFFSPSRPRRDFTATDLAPFANCEVTISVLYPGGVARCGIASLGDLVSLVGPAESGAKVKTKSYSVYEADSRGKTKIKKGRKARDLAINITVPLDMVEVLTDALDEVLDVPVAVIASASDSLRVLRTYGLLDYELTLLATEAKINLSAKGSI